MKSLSICKKNRKKLIRSKEITLYNQFFSITADTKIVIDMPADIMFV